MHPNKPIFILSLLAILSLCTQVFGQDAETHWKTERNSEDTVLLDIADVQGTPGDTICVPITVQNFNSMAGMQFTIHWNPILFEFVEYDNFNLNLSDSFSLLGTNYWDEGFFLLSWVSSNTQIGDSIPDGGVMMDMCFISRGSPGDSSEISIVNWPLSIEMIKAPPRERVPLAVDKGGIEIIPPDTLYGEYSSCPTPAGTEHGSFDVSVYSGTPPYHIQWEHSNDQNLNGTDTIAQAGGSLFYSNLPPTTDSTYYEVIITDQNDSTTTLKVDIEQATKTSLDLGVKNNCPNPGNATIGIDSVQALAPYTLEWNTGQYNVNKIEDLDAGTYTLTLTDRNGCEVTDSFELAFNPFRLDYKTVVDNLCKGTAEGSITIQAKRGNPDELGRYTYRWNDQIVEVDTASTRSGLSSGTYKVTIQDENNCTIKRNITVDNEQAIAMDELTVDSASCYGKTDGSIAFSVFMDGGPEPEDSTYSFAWSSDIQTMSSGDSAWTAPSLAAGNYHVTVYDDPTQAGCRNDFSFTVEEPDSLYHTVSMTPVTDSTATGSIEIHIFGGTPPYVLEWFSQGDPIDPTLDSLEAGTYVLRLTDGNGCQVIDTIEIEDLSTSTYDPETPPQWGLYPNPTDQWLHLECSRCTDRILRWRLIDLQGTIHLGEAYDQGIYPELNIPVESLGPGVYLLHWITENGRTWSRKTVVY